jgi:hypothetical protein
MNHEKLKQYAEEAIGTIENEKLLRQIIEITLTALENYYLHNYEIKDFMKNLYNSKK